MELGKRIKQARLDAGLSQRQLCGNHMTRNMLSLIENGSARPSMDTLQYLAGQLGKPISFFLEEQAVTSPNQAAMADARRYWKQGDAARVLKTLAEYRAPDNTFDDEQGLLSFLAHLRLAEQALQDDRTPYAQSLLDHAGQLQSAYLTAELEQQRQLLLARAGIPAVLNVDETLLIQAEAVLETNPNRCLALLTACNDHALPLWQLLCGLAHYALGDHAAAVPCLSAVEDCFPTRTILPLEICHRELGDYKKAYEYACKARA